MKEPVNIVPEKSKIICWDQAVSWIAFKKYFPRRTQNSANINAAFSTFFENPGSNNDKLKKLMESKSESLEEAAVLLIEHVQSGGIDTYGRKENEDPNLQKIPALHQPDILFTDFPQAPKGAGWQDLHFYLDDIVKIFSGNNEVKIENRGRKAGDGTIDDSKFLLEMDELMSKGKVKSTNQAAEIIAAREHSESGSSKRAAMVARLNRKHAKHKKAHNSLT